MSKFWGAYQIRRRVHILRLKKDENYGIIRYRKSGGNYAYLHIHIKRKIRLGREAQADNTAREGRDCQGDLGEYLLERLAHQARQRAKGGVVHQLGGAMIPVLPVHSQHRGKIFLPFVDDDPKTAEIISKVLLFAEDDKIKDPMILSNISK